MAGNGLETYHARRDFRHTLEPHGRVRAGRAKRPSFVIQKHAARRLHYDLRLEVDGVLRSWAVTRGPSLDPRQKRLAVEVEDHPLEYGTFEGTIPAGEYGGGTVQLWDRGHFSVSGALNAREQLERGKLEFTLDGERLRGGWVLVRMKNERRGRTKRANWLLIKRRDEHAREDAEALLAIDRSVATGRSMAEIATGRARRTRRSGRTASGSLPAFVPPQLATLVARPPEGPRWVHEMKLDGYRMQLRISGGQRTLRTRQGIDWSDRFPTLLAAAAELPDGIYDGEIIALDARGVPSFEALQRALAEGREATLRYFLFDLLFEGRKDLRGATLETRKRRLQRLLARMPRDSPLVYLEHFDRPGDEVLKSACGLNLEGIVSKRIDSPYRAGRNGAWTKAKCRSSQEVVIGGWSTTGREFRSLLIGVQRDGRLVYAGRVGTGFSREKLATLLPALARHEQARSPFQGEPAPKAAANVHWVRPTLVAEIEYAGWTAAGLVRQAAFKGLREDKPASEVVKEQPVTDAAGAVVLGVTLSKPEKVLWPAARTERPVTKIDLARYFERAGPWMLEHLRGRLLSIVRAPDGIEGGRFFQRHATAGQSKLLGTLRLRGENRPFLTVHRVEGLIALAQIAALELHAGNGVPDEPERPGRVVFDLDPAPDVSFERVIEAALELRERLGTFGLTPFCKTTGGKGLHVVAPLSERGAATWEMAKTFAHALCEQMAADSPERYLTSMTKKARVGRIFLDYLRNDRLASAVVPLSPRARPGAPVAMPLAWSQVRKGLDPARFTLRTAPALLARSRAWTDYARSAASLADAAGRLVRSR